VERAGNLVAKNSDRRSFLKKAAVLGAALAANPAGIFERTAYAAGDCTQYNKPCGGDWNCNKPAGSTCSDFTDPDRANGKGGCFDSWTGFCCQMNDGSNSGCPTGTFVAGWWLAATNSSFCGGDKRYIIDCNSRCHSSGNCDQCTGQVSHKNGRFCGNTSGNDPCHEGCIDHSCKCVGDDCSKRRVACNWFRYGNCNQDVDCSGPVVCRLTRCTKPWVEFDCLQNVFELSPSTACHTAICLNDSC
jgi:hypothetical protein